MTKTILPKKTQAEKPLARNDEAESQLIADPTVSQFGNSYAAFNTSSNGTTTFSTASSAGINASGNNDANAISNSNYQLQPNQQPVFTDAGDNAGQNAEILVKHDKESRDWINKRWRPAMGWMYMIVCIFDFIIFPIMYTLVQFYEKEAVNDAFRQWQPLTLAGAGLFHMAMGAVLGIAAYGRTKEKLEGVAKN